MEIIEKIKKNISKILWYVVLILFSLSIYKIYSDYKYKKYVVRYMKKANYYDLIKILQEDAKKYAEDINFKISEYYFVPLEGKFIVLGEGGYFNNKKVYAIFLEFYIYKNILDIEYSYRYIENEKKYIIDEKKIEELIGGTLIYKLNDEKLEELYKKVEEKSGKIW